MRTILIESPGSFTVHHDVDRSEILPDPKFERQAYSRGFLTVAPGCQQNSRRRFQLIGNFDGGKNTL